MTKKINYIYTSIIIISLIFFWLFLIKDGTASKQLDLFFQRCADAFADFTNIVGYSAERDVYNNEVYGFGQKAYPALSYVIAYLFSRMGDTPPLYRDIIYQNQFMVVFFLFLSMQLVILFSVILSGIKAGGVLYRNITAFSIVFSGEMMLLVERGNLFIICIITLSIFVFTIDSKSAFVREMALLCLAISAAFKVIPAVFGVYLIYKKRYKEAIRCTIYGVILFVLPFFFFNGGLSNIGLMFRNMKAFFSEYSDLDGIDFKSLVYQFITVIDPEYSFSELLAGIIRGLGLALSAFLVVIGGLHKRKFELVLTMTIPLLFVPAYSNRYGLLFLIPALICFLNEEKSVKDVVPLIGFIFIFKAVVIDCIVPLYFCGEAILVMYIVILSFIEFGRYLKTKRYFLNK
jgi:hypothetical protein